MNSGSAPPHIHLCHLNYQFANFSRNSRLARAPFSALPSPEEFEALAMPGQNGGWLHHSQTFPPAISEAGEQDPEDTIDRPKPGARSSVNEAPKLVAQRNILGDEICTIFENGGNSGENKWELERHQADHSLSPNDREKSAITLPYRITTRHTPLSVCETAGSPRRLLTPADDRKRLLRVSQSRASSFGTAVCWD